MLEYIKKKQIKEGKKKPGTRVAEFNFPKDRSLSFITRLEFQNRRNTRARSRRTASASSPVTGGTAWTGATVTRRSGTSRKTPRRRGKRRPTSGARPTCDRDYRRAANIRSVSHRLSIKRGGPSTVTTISRSSFHGLAYTILRSLSLSLRDSAETRRCALVCTREIDIRSRIREERGGWLRERERRWWRRRRRRVWSGLVWLAGWKESELLVRREIDRALGF